MFEDLTVLYVEDEAEARNNTARFLKTVCKTLYTACDGLEGMALYEEFLPDLVITDIRMPKMDGIQMARQIRQHNAQQPIIFMTAYSESDYFLRAIEMQVDGYLLKPVDYDLLRKKIADVVAHIRIKREVLSQQRLLGELVDMQEDLLAVLEEHGHVLFANRKFLDFFGVDCVEDFMRRYGTLSACFEEIEGAFTPMPDDNRPWYEQILDLRKKERLVAIKEPFGTLERIFLVAVNRVSRSRHIIIRLAEITEIEQERKELRRKAFMDALTGIYNRTYFSELLYNHIALFNRYGTPFSILFFDIDRFKEINDTYGHRVGDLVLQELTSLVASHIRSCDIFARWGGEEFAVILSGIGSGNAVVVAQNLHKLIDGHAFLKEQEAFSHKGLSLTCSFGVTQVREGDDEVSLMERVDALLYRAKNAGRNRVESDENLGE